MSVKIFFPYICLMFSYVIGLLIFTKGFLLVRTVIHINNTCFADFTSKVKHSQEHKLNVCWSHSPFKKAILIIIDALKYDFMLFNSSLIHTLPFKNKLKSLHFYLTKHHHNARLYKFIADPPTTTLQRLKGITTGSLPTFIDAGSNFHSSEITEDNLIDQLVFHQKVIYFLGDDTWDKLFPNRFFKSFPFPSFNVKDLHTVDNGIINNLYPLLQNDGWDVVIAHFLGVDHCGHRFGPNHPAMADKLTQMDEVIRNVTAMMKNDTILFIFGDHGMTQTGDHGGDSHEELEAGLFVYSPGHITSPLPHFSEKPVSVRQIDFVPTLSLLMGVPIPFSNLGMVIPDLFLHCPYAGTHCHSVEMEWTLVMALRVNAFQVFEYINSYLEATKDFSKQTLLTQQALLKQTEMIYQELLAYVNNGSMNESMLADILDLRDKYEHYLLHIRSDCEMAWAKFDFMSISFGIIAILVTWVVNLFTCITLFGDSKKLPFHIHALFAGVAFHLVCYGFYLHLTSDSVGLIMLALSASVLVGVICAAAMMVVKKCGYVIKEIGFCDYIDVVVVCTILLMYFCVFFSNSYIVHEDSITLFLVQTCLWYCAGRVAANVFHSGSSTKGILGKGKKFKQVPSIVTIIIQFLTHKNVMCFIIPAFCSVIMWCSVFFFACREEQANCKMSLFQQSLSSLSPELASIKNQRYFFSLGSLSLVILGTRYWLQSNGNLNGDAINVIATKFLIPFSGLACALYWAVQALPHGDLDILPHWLQIIMAQIVYCCVIVHIIVNIFQPLYVYIHRIVPSVGSSGPMCHFIHTVPSIFQQLKHNFIELESHTSAVYGFRSVYSSSIIAMALPVYVLLSLLLGDGTSPGLALAVGSMFLCLELSSSLHCFIQHKTEQPVPWVTIVLHGLLSSTFFFATGHQATFPSIRFQSAFTGFHGDFSCNIIPVVLITMNTFASHILFSLLSPLLLVWPHLNSCISQRMAGYAQITEPKAGGEFSLYNNGLFLRKNLFITCSRVLLFHGLKVLAAVCAATIHRRHLMVWKIFAPRFVFEAASFMVVLVMLLLAMLLVIRLDNSISKVIKLIN